MMGMADLGMRAYKKVLEMAPSPPLQKMDVDEAENGGDENDKEDEDEHWTMEAAYAMSTLYALNGNGAKAREITEKYLVV